MRSRRRLVLVGVLWAAATVFGLAFAAMTAIGPIVLPLSRNHGVHAGDLVAFAAAYVLAAGWTLRLLHTAGK